MLCKPVINPYNLVTRLAHAEQLAGISVAVKFVCLARDRGMCAIMSELADNLEVPFVLHALAARLELCVAHGNLTQHENLAILARNLDLVSNFVGARIEAFDVAMFEFALYKHKLRIIRAIMWHSPLALSIHRVGLIGARMPPSARERDTCTC